MISQLDNKINENEVLLSEYFNNFISELRTDELSLKTGVASEDKVKKYNIYSKGTPKEIARYNVSSNSLELIKDLIVDYMKSIKQFNANPTKLAFDWSVNKLRVWAEIKDNDETTENALILSEAKANALNKNYGVYVTTTIVEDSDKLNIPPHYTSIF